MCAAQAAGGEIPTKGGRIGRIRQDQIEIDRKPWQGEYEQIDCRVAFHREDAIDQHQGATHFGRPTPPTHGLRIGSLSQE